MTPTPRTRAGRAGSGLLDALVAVAIIAASAAVAAEIHGATLTRLHSAELSARAAEGALSEIARLRAGAPTLDGAEAAFGRAWLDGPLALESAVRPIASDVAPDLWEATVRAEWAVAGVAENHAFVSLLHRPRSAP